MPEVVWSNEKIGQVTTSLGLGAVEIAGIAGDQQSALFGQMCIKAGDAKNTYGTGCFLLQHIGDMFALSKNRLITTLVCSVNKKLEYAMEGSIFIGGAVVQWLRDNLNLIRKSEDVEKLAASVKNSGGLMFVPAFVGLGAPYWDPYARGMLIGLERGTETGHIARAALDSIAFQVADVLEAMDAETKHPFTELRVDGGASANDLLMQSQADLLGIPITRPAVTETTALGAAYLAGLATDFWDSPTEILKKREEGEHFKPKMEKKDAAALRKRWRNAVERSRDWSGGGEAESVGSEPRSKRTVRAAAAAEFKRTLAAGQGARTVTTEKTNGQAEHRKIVSSSDETHHQAQEQDDKEESMNRKEMLDRAKARKEPWDIVIVGGGATGVGIAVDAASRGFDVLLCECEDFGKGTSSRSTKLVHGGVRYLEQGNVSLVMEALKERGLLRQNAPHLVHDLAFVVPNYAWWETPFYGIGMKIYDLLAGKYGFGKSRILSREETLERLPNIQQEGLQRGVVYYDGQFDDTRLLIHLALTAAEHGATLVNYAAVTEITKDADGYVDGVMFVDSESGERVQALAKVVVNATGIFTDQVRQLSDPSAKGMVEPSQGIHLVFERSFLRGDSAIMVPHTSDGRVLFAIPWHEHTVVGTTDTPIKEPSYDPLPLEQEIDFILDTANLYLSRPPKREDVLSVYVGIRPLVKAAGSDSGKTSALSRDHTIHIDNSGLLTIAGGKWTTYRHMAEDCVNHAITLGKLEDVPCKTHHLHIHGYKEDVDNLGSLWVYGADAKKVRALAASDPELAKPLNAALPYIGAEVVWAAREEMARTVEDALARRTRALFLNAHAAMDMAPAAATLLAKELGRDERWRDAQVKSFLELAQRYTLQKTAKSVA